MSKASRALIIVGLVATLVGLAMGPLHAQGILPGPVTLLLFALSAVVAGLGWLRAVPAVLAGPRTVPAAQARPRTVLPTLGAVLPLALLVPFAWMLSQALIHPIVYDITTDPADPPSLQAVQDTRGPGMNPVDYRPSGDESPPLAPLLVAPVDATARQQVVTLLQARGWDFQQTQDPDLIVATETSAFFGFKDDIAVRFRPVQEDGTRRTRVDLRSQSRIGESDLGVNRRRLEALRTDLAALLSAAPAPRPEASP